MSTPWLADLVLLAAVLLVLAGGFAVYQFLRLGAAMRAEAMEREQ